MSSKVRYMKSGNVLVIGNSGVGKSTLINSVLGQEVTTTKYATKKLDIYQNNEVPFRIIDSIGFEPNFKNEWKAIYAVHKWSKNCTKTGKEENQINVIWFCVDGTSKKLFPKAIKSFSRAISVWKNVPIIIVITKSYSYTEREENIRMVQEAFSNHTHLMKNIKAVVPVVASAYEINDQLVVEPNGIEELIDKTNELMPEGLRAGKNDLDSYILNRKRYLSHSVVLASATSATVIGAVPIPFPDGALLTPLETAEIRAIAKLYGIDKKDKSKKITTTIVEAGTVGVVAKTAIQGIKAIPGINIAAAALNAIVAGSIVVALGEASIYIFEQIILGNKTLEDIDWINKVLNSKVTNELTNKLKNILENSDGNINPKEVIQQLVNMFISKYK